MSSEILISFSVAPVQSAISQARSVRDLWTGSYLISWLTARAAATALELSGEFDDPQWELSPLVQRHRKKTTTQHSEAELRSSSLPNTFLFRLKNSVEKAAEVARSIEKAVQAEWKAICDDVHKKLASTIGSQFQWDAGWSLQLDSFWHVRVEYLELGAELESSARALGCPPEEIIELKNSNRLAEELLGRVTAAGKMLRPVRPHGLSDDSRAKCTVSGEDAQMGPLDYSMKDSTAFWDGPMTQAVRAAGERLRKGERLGAPALVKRLAWSCSLSKRLGQKPQELRTSDTATIAAGPWFAKLRQLDESGNTLEYFHEWVLGEKGDWSGQWLHRSEKGEEEAPSDVRLAIEQARSTFEKLKLPTYFAVLMMDGDQLGERLRRCNKEERNKLTEKLSGYSRKVVPETIQEYLHGKDGLRFNQPIYAGGDDVLALVPLWMPNSTESKPLQSALGLGHTLSKTFGELNLPGMKEVATMSAGIAVVHYKEDLRLALDAARKAEKQAKNDGRNRATLTVLRRSGEHTTASIPWKDVAQFENLVKAFVGGASDRWVYKLRQIVDELATSIDESKPVLDTTFVHLIDSECARLIGHTSSDVETKTLFNEAWDTFTNRKIETNRTTTQQLNAITLIQSASFIARGREEA